MEAKRILAALLLGVVCLIGGAWAGRITGTGFPFEPCVQKFNQNRFYGILTRNDWDPKVRKTRVCFTFFAKPEEQCVAGGNRCCDTDFVKFKFYPQFGCRGSVGDIRVNGRSLGAIAYERSGARFIGKITTLKFKYANVNNSTICWSLGSPCRTLYNFANRATRDMGMLEYALYDKKYLDPESKQTMKKPYECCPTGVFIFNMTAAAESGRLPGGFPYNTLPDFPTDVVAGPGDDDK